MALQTLGLWGDGDEVQAIEDAFKAVGVDLPVEHAPGWRTVGDLWRSVECVAPVVASSGQHWDSFRKAVAQETCVPWESIDAETTLLDGRGHSALSRLWTSLKERIFKNA